MKEVVTGSDALGIWATLQQMAKVLGFHDLLSFFLVTVFLLCAVAFVITGAIFLVKKRRERLADLEKIVLDVQRPLDRRAHDEPSVAKTASVATKPVKKIVPATGLATPVSTSESKPALKPKIISEPKKPAQTLKEPKPSTEPAKIFEPLGVTDERQKPVVVPVPDAKTGLGAALKNTRGGFMEKLSQLFTRSADISDEDFEEIEAILFTADIGAKTAQKLLDGLRARVREQKISDKTFLRSVLKEEMRRILDSAEPKALSGAETPQVFMFVGVNGAGKTTSIGKLGAQLAKAGKKVLFGAGDTFRAAATEQLNIWGERVGAKVISGKENSDSASVLFEAIEKAKADQADYVLCDTAGRLHTKISLMDELKKVHRVVNKAQAGAPHEVFLVIDATMGQNAITQAREFAAATPLTGVVLSKLDGTAKGGVALGIVDELKVPIRYVGIGEQVADLRVFDAKLFVDALFDEA